MESENTNTTQTDIMALEATKTKLIEEARAIYKKLDYKKFEKAALEPFVKETSDMIDTRRLRREKRDLEFKISTQAFTPKTEKAIVKQIKIVDEKLSKLIKKEKIIRKYRLVVGDIEELTKQAENKELEIKEIKKQLREIYIKNRKSRNAGNAQRNRGKGRGKNKDEEILVSLEDLIETK